MRKNDMILAGVILLAVGALLLLQRAAYFSRQEGTVVIYQEKGLAAAYPLSEDKEEIFYTADGGMNRLIIKDGEAWIEDADCPDRLCVKQGHISKKGQAVTCLPHKLTIVIEQGEEPEVDAVVR